MKLHGDKPDMKPRIIKGTDDRRIKIRIDQGDESVSFREVLDRWRNDAAFRTFFNALLADSVFKAFRWELPPLTPENVDCPFACMLIKDQTLVGAPDPEPFAEQFVRARSPEVLQFANLGGDAVMVVPAPGEPLSAYPHIGAFVRKAPCEQRDRLWQSVGEAMADRLGEQPVWLNTAGTGVVWLHVRLDDRPKYYLHAPYRSHP